MKCNANHGGGLVVISILAIVFAALVDDVGIGDVFGFGADPLETLLLLLLPSLAGCVGNVFWGVVANPNG